MDLVTRLVNKVHDDGFGELLRLILFSIKISLFHRRGYYRRIRYHKNNFLYDAPPKPRTILYVNPHEIRYAHTESEEFDWNPGKRSQHTLHHLNVKRGGFLTKENVGRIADGDWDLARIPFETTNIYRALDTVFNKGGDWEDTDLFGIYLDNIRSGQKPFGCSSIKELKEKRGAYIQWLYNNIKEHGYVRQRRTLEHNGVLIGPRENDFYHEIGVNIGRNGELIFNKTGHHRLAVAKLINIEKIPVLVVVRHKKWQELRDKVSNDSDYGDIDVTHPDLQDVL